MLIGTALTFGGRRGRRAFSPASLFASGEVGAWYDPSDLTTLFQDTAGTTPVTTPGQTVALMLDKSRGGIGSQLVTNGNFSNGSTGWTLANATVSGGVLNVTNGSRFVAQNAGLVTGQLYYVSYNWTTGAAVSGALRINTGSVNGQQSALETVGLPINSSGTVSGLVTAIGSFIAIEAALAPFNGTIDNISVRAAPGNHATQATAAQRPTYGIEPMTGRRNLLLQSQSIQSSPWVGFFVSGASSTVVSPDGVSFAAAITGSGDTSTSWSQTYSSAPIATYTFSLWLIADSAFSTSITIGGTTLTVGVTTGWQRFSVTTTTASVANLTASFRPSINAGVVRTVYAWGAQLETGSTATAYQRVTTQFDVTEAGVASKSYLRFDGVDDGMATSAINFTATDKMTVFGGVRKIGTASYPTLVDLGNTGATGGFAFFANSTSSSQATLANYDNNLAAYAQATFNSVPLAQNSVLTSQHDRGPTGALNELSLRVNGAAVTGAQDASYSNSTGNFGNLALFIGRRGGTTLPLNAQVYGLIVRGAATDAATITSTETWVNSKTGAY
jgi:hypothetical protein